RTCSRSASTAAPATVTSLAGVTAPPNAASRLSPTPRSSPILERRRRLARPPPSPPVDARHRPELFRRSCRGGALTMDLERNASLAASIEDAVGKRIAGQPQLIRQTLVGLLAEGHVLLEGVPGLGKTELVKAFSAAIGVDFARVQFTPDLMPADIVGTQVLEEDDHGRRLFRYRPGPVFTNLLLADEINRATPKTQAALLEAMQERHVTVAGET